MLYHVLLRADRRGRSMCSYCGFPDDDQIIEDIQCNAVPEDVFFCDDGWREASRVWGTYGWARKQISRHEWRAVCEARSEARRYSR